jgi:hypothetical protein
MKIGITGTKEGFATEEQLESLLNFFIFNARDWYVIREFHHGDCVGVDVQVAALMKDLFPSVKIISHPPKNDKFRAWFESDVILEEKDYLVRNHDIVNTVDVMLGVPKENHEILRSGTWATIRYSIKKRVPLRIFYPSGIIEPIEW